jgi:regulator of replication initiation timing
MSDQVSQLEQTISELTSQRDQISGEVETAQQELSGLRQEAEELSGSLEAARAELADLEQQIEAEQPDAMAEPEPQATIEPGSYEAGQVIAEFGPDGRFQMARRDGSQVVEGRYEVDDDVVTLSDVSGDLGRTSFPMRCRLAAVDGGFRLEAVNGSCQELAGTTFTR